MKDVRKEESSDSEKQGAKMEEGANKTKQNKTTQKKWPTEKKK